MLTGIIDSGQKIITDGLVLHLDAAQLRSYPTTGTTWTDLSGNGNNGTLTNGPTFDSANGGSIVFDNINDYVITTAGATPTLNITNSITIETWLMTTTLASADHGDGVISKGVSSDGNSGVYETLIVPSGGVNYPFFRMRIGAATPTYFPLNIPLTINQIFQFISTYDGSRIRIYVNSVQSGTGLSASGTIEVNAQELAIGIRYNHIVLVPRNSYFGGKIYNCKIYNRALSATEILQNYNATKSRFGL